MLKSRITAHEMETRLLLNYKFQIVKGCYGFSNEILTILMSLHTKL